MGVELFQGDERADIMKLIVTFGNFANAPNNCSLIARGLCFEIYTHFLCDCRVDSGGKRPDLLVEQQKFDYQQVLIKLITN